MIVTITSCTLNFAFNSPGIKPHSAPAKAAAINAKGKWTNLEAPSNAIPT